MQKWKDTKYTAWEVKKPPQLHKRWKNEHTEIFKIIRHITKKEKKEKTGKNNSQRQRCWQMIHRWTQGSLGKYLCRGCHTLFLCRKHFGQRDLLQHRLWDNSVGQFAVCVVCASLFFCFFCYKKEETSHAEFAALPLKSKASYFVTSQHLK